MLLRTFRAFLMAMLALPGAAAAVAQTPPPMHSDDAVFQVGPEYAEEAFGPCDSCDACGCAECCCVDPGRWTAAFSFTILKPHFDYNTAMRSTNSDGVNFTTTTDTTFDNDLDLSPRVWLEYTSGAGMGIRSSYWQFDHDANPQARTPNANGFETLSTPSFGEGIASFLSTARTGETLTVFSGLDFETLDLEGTKWVDYECWTMVTTAGLRYASLKQYYRGVLRDANQGLLSTIDYGQRFDGLGPTMSFEARRPLGPLTLFGMARGSLMYGNGKSELHQAQNLNLAAPFFASQVHRTNDLLPVAELQIGFEWEKEFGCGGGHLFVRNALEGQLWQNGNDSASPWGDLGFFGLSVAVGISR